jgi:hypothetical protein
MRKRLLFVSLAFVGYWLFIHDSALDSLVLDPVKPLLVPVLNPAYDLEEPHSSEDGRPAVAVDELMKWLKAEASAIGKVDPNPPQTLVRLQSKAEAFSKGDLATLKRLALNRNFDADERFLAVFMIGLAGADGLDLLRELSLARVPGVPSDRQHSDEVVLRTHVIETLVQKLPREDARQLLQQLLHRTSDPIIARHVQYWLNRLS